MKQVIAELDFQRIDDDWYLRPVFWVPRDEPEAKPKVVVHIHHRHADTKEPMQFCGLVNREAFLEGAFPEYECNKCVNTEVPTSVVEEKLLAESRYKGYDPRNNRRAAVLATKQRKATNVK